MVFWGNSREILYCIRKHAHCHEKNINGNAEIKIQPVGVSCGNKEHVT